MNDTNVAVKKTASARKSGTQGLTFGRFFTREGVHPLSSFS